MQNMRAWQARDENTSRVECLIRNEECLLYTKTLNNGFQELSKNIIEGMLWPKTKLVFSVMQNA